MMSMSRNRAILAYIQVFSALGLWVPQDGIGQDVDSIVDDGDVNVTLLATNLADEFDLMTTQGEPSFAAWVEVGDRAFLFDTGWTPDNVLFNAKTLEIDLSRAEDLIISHHHYDHVGGIETLRKELSKINPKALSRVHVAAGMFASRPEPDGREDNLMIGIRQRMEATGAEFFIYDKPTEIAPGVWVTGPIPRIHAEKNYPVGPSWMLEHDGEIVPDYVPESQVLVIQAKGGPIVVTGCGHAGLINSLEYTKVSVSDLPPKAALGGFHLFVASDEVMSWTSERIMDLQLEYLLGAHCTGIERVYQIRDLTDMDHSRARVGAIGTRFNGAEGIIPGLINR